MSKRLLCLTLLTLTMLANSGCNCICCLHDNLLASYKSRRWADCGCCDTYWGPWIDTPPKCCDPCDCYGNFTGGRQYWSPGYQGGHMGGPMIGTSNMTPAAFDDSMDGMPMPSQPAAPIRQMPTPADPQMEMPQPSRPPMGPPVRTGRRPYGMAMKPDPWKSSYTYPPSRAAYFQRSEPAW